ncbi:hypothetical protein, partial [Aeromonas salmonicida]
KTTSRMLVTDKRLCVWCPNRRSVFSAKPYRKIICRRVTATGNDTGGPALILAMPSVYIFYP